MLLAKELEVKSMQVSFSLLNLLGYNTETGELVAIKQMTLERSMDKQKCSLQKEINLLK